MLTRKATTRGFRYPSALAAAAVKSPGIDTLDMTPISSRCQPLIAASMLGGTLNTALARADVTSGEEMDWVEAGGGWGTRAKEWAYLFEPYARTANELVFDRLGVGSGTSLLDVACGSGFAAALAATRGCTVTGLDAADPLLDIARVRTPAATFECGDMFAMPFPDETFDAATSFNGIWKGCEQALLETHRVLKPGGQLGLTFWGPLDRLGLLPYFLKVMELSAPSHGGAMMNQGDTGSPGVIEEMLSSTGFNFNDRGTVEVINEWPDVATAVRAMAAAGPSVPAIENVGYDAFVDSLTDLFTPTYSDKFGVRICSEFGWVTARAN